MNETIRKPVNEYVATERDRTAKPSSDPGDRVTALCEAVRELAASTAEDAIESARQQAEALIAEATLQAEAEYRAQLAKAKERLQKQLDRQLQNARLESRARLETNRWNTLTAVLDEAEQRIQSMHDSDPERYYAALVRFVQSACKQLACDRPVVHLNPADLAALHQCLQQHIVSNVEFVESNIAAGALVSTADRNVIIDHSIVRRRQRCDAELRLTAAETLFAEVERNSVLQGATR